MGESLGWLRRFGGRRILNRARQRRAGLVLAAAVIASTPSAGASTPALIPRPEPVARPALWVVSDHDTIIYLFGTFHAHDGRAHWFTDAVKTAFDGSEELVLETVLPSSPEELKMIIDRHRAGRVARTAAPAGNGLATARIAMTAARSTGMSVEKGADTVLFRAATAAGKPVEGLESFASQLQMYDRLPPAKSAAQPTVSAATSGAPVPSNPAMAAAMRQMMLAWDRGDQATFEAVVGTIQTRSPDAYRMMFQQRNFEWAGWIARRLQEPGTVFVAVGTGHLVGYHSVQAQLALRGIRTARVN